MQVRTLIAKLEEIQSVHGNRLPVTCSSKLMQQACNGVFDITDISKVKVDWVLTVDGDGFQEHRKDGTERGRTCVVLS